MSSTSAGARERLSAQADYIFGVSESLMKHPKFFVFLHDVVNYLRLSDQGWASILHVRRDSHDSMILKESHPELFKIPNDIINQVDTLRSGEKWNHYKRVVLERFSERASHARKLSLQIPEPQHRPASYASTASSTWSSLPLYSGSEDSVRSSMSSGYISDWSAHDHLRAVSRGRAPWKTDSATWFVSPSPAARRTRRMVDPKKCQEKCPACDKLYEKHGNLINHLMAVHPEHPAARKHNPKDFRNLPTPSPDVREDAREPMPPPSYGSSAIKGMISDLGASNTAPEDKPLPPVPTKDASKRPLPDSPTSQFGPRVATEPSADFESEPCATDAVIEDNWSECFDDDLCGRIRESLSNHDYHDIGQDMELFN